MAELVALASAMALVANLVLEMAVVANLVLVMALVATLALVMALVVTLALVMALVAILALVMALVATLALVASLALAVLLADLVDLHFYLLPHHFSEASLPFIMIMTGDLVAQVTVRATTATLVIAPIIQALEAQILATPIATIDTVELTIRLPTTKIWFMLVT